MYSKKENPVNHKVVTLTICTSFDNYICCSIWICEKLHMDFFQTAAIFVTDRFAKTQFFLRHPVVICVQGQALFKIYLRYSEYIVMLVQGEALSPKAGGVALIFL